MSLLKSGSSYDYCPMDDDETGRDCFKYSKPHGRKEDLRKNKSKKKHKHKKRSKSPSNSDDDFEWVEAKVEGKEEPKKEESTEKEEPKKLQREDWLMMGSSFGPTISQHEIRDERKKARDEKKQDRLQLDNPGQHELELNPYWRDGGKGLPTESTSGSDVSLSTAKVGDGGVHWLRKAYQRAKEQAKEEGRSLEEVVAERWGSLDNLESQIRLAEDNANSHRRGSDRHSKYHRHDRRKSDKERAPTQARFYKPDEEEFIQPEGRDKYPNDRYSSRSSKWRRVEKKVSEATESETKESRRISATESETKESRRISATESETKESRRISAIESETKESRRISATVSAPITSDFDEEPERIPVSNKIVEQKHLSDEEMNKLGANILKAEIMGNTELANKLKKQLQISQNLRKFGGDSSTGETNEAIVVVRGRSSNQRNAGKNKSNTHGADGKRVHHFADDGKHSLRELFEREKFNTAEDENLFFSKLASKSMAQSKSADFDFDEVVMTSASKKEWEQQAEQSRNNRAIREFQSTSAALDSCSFCFESKVFARHLAVSVSSKVCLCLPSFESLVKGHCMIVPMQHLVSMTQVDEDVWEEVQHFRKVLTRMFDDSNEDVVFFEICKGLKFFPHTVIECVPLPRDVGDTAPIYFKKAILECEAEWSMNKKVVDLSTKDVRRAVPKGLPYFAVDFGLQGGFAHVIEDEKLFPKNFAQEIIGGMLDLAPQAWRKPRRENFDRQQDKVFDFVERWRPYDWTKKL